MDKAHKHFRNLSFLFHGLVLDASLSFLCPKIIPFLCKILLGPLVCKITNTSWKFFRYAMMELVQYHSSSEIIEFCEQINLTRLRSKMYSKHHPQINLTWLWQ